MAQERDTVTWLKVTVSGMERGGPDKGDVAGE